MEKAITPAPPVYVAIKGSLHADDCSAFGLNDVEIKALESKFPCPVKINNTGHTFRVNALDAINAMGQLGYKLVSSTDKDNHSHNHAACTCFPVTTSVHQTLSEMDWERGIWYAALNGDIDRVQTIINKSSTSVITPDDSGYTALHYAARNGHFDICQMLLSNGAQVDAQTKSAGATPLHKAATVGQLKILKLLLNNKACVDKQDVDGQTALHRAAERNHQDVTEFLLKTYPHLEHIRDNKGRAAMDFL